jgi:hypothetical protein
MSWKAVFVFVTPIKARPPSCQGEHYKYETYLFLVITIEADSKQRQLQLWMVAAAVPAVVDSDCGWWLLTAAADDDDGTLRMKTMAAGSGRGGS